MNSPNTAGSQRCAALTAALASPSGEMDQVLTQLIKNRSVPSSPPSSPVVPTTPSTCSPLVPLPATPSSPQHTVSHDSQQDTLAPNIHQIDRSTTENATQSQKKPFCLDLSSPANINVDIESPVIIKTERIAEPSQSISSILGGGDLSESQCAQASLPNDESQPSSILDLSRPITSQKYDTMTSSMKDMSMVTDDEVPMEVPIMNSGSSPGDFTQLGMQFESLSAEAPVSGIWEDKDFKYNRNEAGATESPVFRCSQLDVPFSQLEKLADKTLVKNEQSPVGSSQRSPNPSNGALYNRASRAAKRIMNNASKRKRKMKIALDSFDHCINAMKKCSAKSSKNLISDTKLMVMGRLKSAGAEIAAIKAENKADQATIDRDGKPSWGCHQKASHVLAEELGTLTKTYLKYRDVVLMLRDFTSAPPPTTNPNQLQKKTAAEKKKKSVEKETKAVKTEKTGPYKRESLCVVQGHVVSEAPKSKRPRRSNTGQSSFHNNKSASTQNKASASNLSKSSASNQNKSSASNENKSSANNQTVKHLDSPPRLPPKRSSQHDPRFQTPSPIRVKREKHPKTPEQLQSQIVVEEFFRSQLQRINQTDTHQALPMRVAELRKGSLRSPGSSPKHPASSSQNKSSTQQQSSKRRLKPQSSQRQSSQAQLSQQHFPQIKPQLSQLHSSGESMKSSPESLYGSSQETQLDGFHTPQQPAPVENLYPSPAIKEIVIKNSRFKTPEQIKSRVHAHHALSDLELIHVTPQARKKQKSSDDIVQLSYKDLLRETLPAPPVITQEKGCTKQIISAPTQDCPMVEKVVEFLIKKGKLIPGYQSIYTILSEDRVYASIDNDGYVLHDATLHKSCVPWIKSVHQTADLDTLKMVYSAKNDKTLCQEMEGFWKKSQPCETERPVQGSFTQLDRDGLEFFDIVSLLQSNVEIRIIGAKEFVPHGVLGLPPDFWITKNAGIPASLLADIDDWP